MARPRIVPDKNTLQHWLDEGLTHQQMADRIYEQTGERVNRTAVSAALQRSGLAKKNNRYRQTVPWRVKVGHSKAYPVRMLRLLGRRQMGQELTDAEAIWLDNWLEDIAEQDLIVAYDPDDDLGFHYIESRFKDHKLDIPIRRQEIHIGYDTLKEQFS